MPNFFEEIGRKIVGEVAHVVTDAVVDVVKEGVKEIDKATRTPLSPPPKLEDIKENDNKE